MNKTETKIQTNKPATTGSFSIRIGNTMYIVCVKQSETAQKPIEKVFEDMCKHAVLGDISEGKSSNLERL